MRKKDECESKANQTSTKIPTSINDNKKLLVSKRENKTVNERDKRKNLNLKRAFTILMILIPLILIVGIIQAVMQYYCNFQIEILDNINSFFQYAVTTILGYMFAIKTTN